MSSINRKLANLITVTGDVASSALDNVDAASMQVFSSLDSLPTSSLSAGDQALVGARLYISNGSGWYNVALINATPTLTIDPTGAVALATDGSTPTVITLTGTDSDNADAGLIYSVESDGSFGGLATLSQDSSVFTITPLGADSATTVSSTLTFKVSDGINFGSGTTTFSLTFIVDDINYTRLLVKADAAETDAQVDASTNAHTITENGDVTSTAFTPYHPGGYSVYFDGTGDYLQSPSNADFGFGTGDFTVEWWAYQTQLNSYSVIFATGYGAGGIGSHMRSNGDITVTRPGTAIDHTFAAGVTSANRWYHVALVRSGTDLTCFVDGVSKGTVTNSTNYAAGTLNIGIDGNNGSSPYKGYISDFRSVKGTAVYTSNFTPPTERLTAIANTKLLTCHLPYIADGSSSSHAITAKGNASTSRIAPYDTLSYTKGNQGGSVYFDGTNDYLDAGDIQFGANDFTIEGWFYFNSTADQCLIGRFHNYSSNQCWDLIYESSSLRFQTNAGSFNNGSVSWTPVPNVWYHIAAVRSGSNKYLFVNGVLQSGYPINIGTGALQGESTGTVKIGTRHDLSKDFNGYMSDVRFVTGTAVYTSNFTPPTSKLTAISGTALLTCTNNNTIWDASGNYQTITVAGTAAASNTQRKFTGSSSLFLDGNSDYLQFAHPSNTPDAFNFGTEDFTMETWVYPQATGNNYPSFFSSVTGWSTGASGHRFDNIGKSGKYTFHLNGASPSDPFLESTNAFTHDTWVHYALTREGNTFRMFINGALEASGTYTGSYNAANGGLRLGWAGWDGADGYFAGYLQNVRITKRLARYTANFTPPTAEFEG